MSWIAPKIWEGGDVWIIGGGPSITKLFGIPKEVVQSVIAGTSPLNVYSPYMKELHDKHVIGINVAYMLGDWVDVVFFGDHSFFLKNEHKLAEFPGLKVCCDPHAAREPWIKYVARDVNHVKGISPDPRKVSWNHNSGAASISLAVHMGAKRIMLLGFDMKLGDNKAQHWHDVYHRMESRNPRKAMEMPFDMHLMGFKQIDIDAKKLGVEILNLSPDSSITQFRKVALEECYEYC
jgi:hypothetical protein